MPKDNVAVQFKVASVEMSGPYTGYPITFYIYLKDGGKFTAALINNEFSKVHDAQQMKKLGIEAFQDFKGKTVRITGRVEPFDDPSFRMFVRDLNKIEVVKE